MITYLALGDSYTIGEQVRIAESFPYQTVQLLRKYAAEENIHPASSTVASPDGNFINGDDEVALAAFANNFAAPEIVAATGWTTDELSAAMDATEFLLSYDIVSLLIGVNNQYRERSATEYSIEFEALLKKAIALAGNRNENVFVLSIPDWGTTAFAKDRDINKIASEIDHFNDTAKNICAKYKVCFIDITTAQRKDSGDESFVASDGLHPSGKEYAKWAGQLADKIIEQQRKNK